MKFLLDHDVPENLSHLLKQLGHDVILLREALPKDASDEAVFQLAHERSYLLLTCNRDDFLHLATKKPHHGLVIIIRRQTRAAERAAPGACGRYRPQEQRQLRLSQRSSLRHGTSAKDTILRA